MFQERRARPVKGSMEAERQVRRMWARYDRCGAILNSFSGPEAVSSAEGSSIPRERESSEADVVEEKDGAL
jgi:hypothetical protein